MKPIFFLILCQFNLNGTGVELEYTTEICPAGIGPCSATHDSDDGVSGGGEAASVVKVTADVEFFVAPCNINLNTPSANI